MTFVCTHKEFSDAVNDPDHGLIARGNIMSNTQSSTYVRAFIDTECNGFTSEPGKLRDFDLAFFGRALPAQVSKTAKHWSRESGTILYRFFHWKRRLRIEHGWLITSRDHQVLSRFITGPTYKSRDAVLAAEALIASGRRH